MKKNMPVTAQELAARVNARAAVKVRESMGLSVEEFSRVTRYPVETIARWETGHPMSEQARGKYEEIQRLGEALSRIARLEGIAKWLGAPSALLEGKTPFEVLERGESERVWRVVRQIESNGV